MTEKELREIKRRFRPEKSNIPRIVGCFVNASKQIVARISQPIAMQDEDLTEKLLKVMKKALSGSLGTNLTDIAFSTKQVSDSEEHKLLMRLRGSALGDTDALESFYAKVIDSLSFDSSYVILLANDVYDVFKRNSDGSEGDSTEVFSYIVCAICPVKDSPEALFFRESDSLFHTTVANALLSSPELGFMFPCFDDRRTNIYNALYYVRSVSESYPDFTQNIFASESKMPPRAQKATFNECLVGALEEECSYELVRSVHRQVAEMNEAHKESHEPEPLVISKSTVKTILAGCGVGEERLEAVGAAMDESFGKDAELSPKNIVSTKRFEVSTPEVSIKVDPEHTNLVSTQIIGDAKYIVIRVDGSVEVNGIAINFEE
ncbi:MAG: DUF4317 domain-containing protein [Clostridia bacterium]|nr:DUF4317 domain-containing protein [Clostridia bacterium]